MSGNARFHDKLHRANHHTLSTGGLLDSAYDPIASPEHPFRGDFILSGGLSALGDIIANGLTIKNAINIEGNTTTQNQTIVGSLELHEQHYGGTAIYAINPTTRPEPFTLSLNYENGVFVSNDFYTNGIIYGNMPMVAGTTPNTTDISIGYVTLKTNSAFWQNVFNTVNANSATWTGGGGGSDVSVISANWQNTYTTVSSNSSKWLSKSSLVSAASAYFTNLSSNYLSLKSYSETSTSVTSPGSPAIYNIDLATATVFRITLTTNVGLAYGGGFQLLNIPPGVNSFLIILTQSNVGNVLVSFDFIGNTVKWSDGAPTVTPTANATDIYSFMSVDGNTWYGAVAGKNFV